MSGSFTDQYRKRLESKNKAESTKDQLADKFNKTATKLIDEFMNEVASGNIRIDDTADMMRLFQIYFEINELNNATGDGTGSLPQLSQRQSKHLRKYVETEEVEAPSGGYEDVIDPESLMNLGEDEIANMIKEREIEMNADNAEEWEEGIIG